MKRAIVLCVILVQGCGWQLHAQRAEGMHDVLDAVTHVVDPAYGAAVTACDAAEGDVVRREGTTQKEDETAIAEIRMICDRIFFAFESVRQAQIMSRNAVEAARGSESNSDRVKTAIEAVRALKAAVGSAKQVWEVEGQKLFVGEGGHDG